MKSDAKKDKKTERSSKRRTKRRWIVSIAFMTALFVFAETGALKWTGERMIGIYGRMFGYNPEPWNKATVLETVQIGEEVIAAIEHYKEDISRYPQTLSLLTPKYLSSIPDPITGELWWSYQYQRSKEYPAVTTFRLGVYSEFYRTGNSSEMLDSVIYNSSSRLWEVTHVTMPSFKDRVIEKWPLDREASDPLTPPKGHEVSADAPY